MYDLKDFFKDFVITFKKIHLAVKWSIVIAQIVLGFHALMVCCFAFSLPMSESILYSFILPGLAIWIPVLWRNWERTEE